MSYHKNDKIILIVFYLSEFVDLSSNIYSIHDGFLYRGFGYLFWMGSGPSGRSITILKSIYPCIALCFTYIILIARLSGDKFNKLITFKLYLI